MPQSKRIAELLIDIGAVKLRTDPPFTWTSGLKSPVYCDNRMVYSHPEARKYIVDALVERVRLLHVEPDAVAGTATAAIGWGALVADRLGLPFVYVRSKPKDHGTEKLIEGDLKKGCDVVLIEDLISTGGSSVRSVQALRAEGEANVHDVVAIFSYELLASRESADEANVRFHPLSTFGTLLEVAAEQGRINRDEIDAIGTFANDPEQWGKTR